LDSCQFKTLVVADVPRVRCLIHGTQMVQVPWASPRGHFTAMFERFAIDVMLSCATSKACELLRISWDEADGIMARAVQRGLARRTLERLGLGPAVPGSMRQALSQPTLPATVDPPPVNIIIARNADLLAAAAAEARRLGFPVQVVTERLQGEASTVGARLGRRLRESAPPACLLAVGETTVTLRRGGRGGRNQELALSAALILDGAGQTLLAAFASDGIDGPTHAAGAWVDGSTIERARACGLDARQALEAHDTYPFLDQIGALLLTGPTGTNLNDLVVGLTYGA